MLTVAGVRGVKRIDVIEVTTGIEKFMNKITCLTVTNRRPEEVTKETKLSKERLPDDVLARELSKFQLRLAVRSTAASTPRARKATSLIAPSLLAAPTPSSLVGALPGLVKALEVVAINAL